MKDLIKTEQRNVIQEFESLCENIKLNNKSKTEEQQTIFDICDVLQVIVPMLSEDNKAKLTNSIYILKKALFVDQVYLENETDFTLSVIYDILHSEFISLKEEIFEDYFLCNGKEFDEEQFIDFPKNIIVIRKILSLCYMLNYQISNERRKILSDNDKVNTSIHIKDLVSNKNFINIHGYLKDFIDFSNSINNSSRNTLEVLLDTVSGKKLIDKLKFVKYIKYCDISEDYKSIVCVSSEEEINNDMVTIVNIIENNLLDISISNSKFKPYVDFLQSGKLYDLPLHEAVTYLGRLASLINNTCKYGYKFNNYIMCSKEMQSLTMHKKLNLRGGVD